MNLALIVACQKWCRWFHKQHGYLPTVLWVDRVWWNAMYIEAMAVKAPLPGRRTGINCNGIGVYQR
jgi:hypothetical protein